jgi:hypothetical protein
MEWGMIMAIPTIIGMLVLIFAQSRTTEDEAFGSTVLNEPSGQYTRTETHRKVGKQRSDICRLHFKDPMSMSPLLMS